ncbi:MAG: glycosyltransferase family 2 protein [Patescibacteria group bacterium]
MKTVGVIPAYNEEGRIIAVLQGCLPHLDGIIVVDDGSTDQTSAAVKNLNNQKIVVLRHAVNRNQGAALRTGTIAALNNGADIIVHIDADGQHDPAELPGLLQPILQNDADVVFGSRFLGVAPTGMPSSRRWILKCGRWFNILALGISRRVTDPQSGLRAMSARAARQINFYQDGKAHASEILRSVTRSDLRWMEVPAHVKYTKDSLAKDHSNKISDAPKIAWQLFVGLFTK